MSIAEVIYKQMILLLFEYADFMVESSDKTTVDCLERLPERDVMYIDNNMSNGMKFHNYMIHMVCSHWSYLDSFLGR